VRGRLTAELIFGVIDGDSTREICVTAGMMILDETTIFARQ